MASFINNAELGYFEQETGVIPWAEAERSMNATARFLRAPGGAEFWKRHGRNDTPEFTRAIEDMIEDVSQPKPG